MNINTLIQNERDAIAGDSSIENWCYTNYESYPTLYVGIDLDNPPSEDDYPVIHLYPIAKKVGYELTKQNHLLGCTVGLKDTTLSTSTQGNTSVKEYQGIQRIESMRKLVETVIKNNVSSDTFIDVLDIDYAPPECFPLFLADMIFMITQSYYQGTDDDVFA